MPLSTIFQWSVSFATYTYTTHKNLFCLSNLILTSLNSLFLGTQIFTNIWHIHNSDNQWECSTKVQPERFLDKDGLPKTKSDKIFDNYMPFGRGKRTCVGAKIVQDVVFLFISNLVRTQTFELSTSVPKLIGNGDMNHSPPAFKVIFSTSPWIEWNELIQHVQTKHVYFVY